MAIQTVYPYGDSALVSVPLLSKIALRTTGTASYALQTNTPNVPAVYGAPISWTNGQLVLGTFTTVQGIAIYAGATPVTYDISTNPNASPYVIQKAAAAKTTSTTLTALELLQGIITVNQGAAGASALTLPLATDMDLQFNDSIADDGIEFSVTNISTVAAESATIVTNTGWTITLASGSRIFSQYTGSPINHSNTFVSPSSLLGVAERPSMFFV